MLTEPPSSVNCFRDVTLYMKMFLERDNILKCKKGTRSIYWKWIKQYGAHDFIEEIILDSETQEGIKVGPNDCIRYDVLNEYNYTKLIEKLKHF